MSNWLLKAELKTRQAVENFVKGEEAPTAVEYGLMVALVAVAIIVAVTALGNGVAATFAEVTAELSTAAGGE